MKKLLLGTILLVLAIVVPIQTRAQVITSSPPPIAFEGPPDVIVMPDTNHVYVVPDIEDDMFFWDGSTSQPPGTAYSRRLILHGREKALSTPGGSRGMPRRGIAKGQGFIWRLSSKGL